MKQNAVWKKQQNWASLSVFHSLVWKEEAVSLTSTHSFQQANAASEKNHGIFEEMLGLNNSEGSLTFKLDVYFMSHEWSQKQTELGLLLPAQLPEKKEKLPRMRIKYKHPRHVKSLESNWDWSQGSSIGLFPMVFRDAYVIQKMHCLLHTAKFYSVQTEEKIVFWPHEV